MSEVSRKDWITYSVQNICFFFWTSSDIQQLSHRCMKTEDIRQNFTVYLCRQDARCSLTWRGYPCFCYQDGKRNVTSFLLIAKLLICIKHSPTSLRERRETKKSPRKSFVRSQGTQVCWTYTCSFGSCLKSQTQEVFCLFLRANWWIENKYFSNWSGVVGHLCRGVLEISIGDIHRELAHCFFC